MLKLIETNRSKIMHICQRHKVRRLEIFGSATKGEFDKQSSDLDFLVEFQDMDFSSYADAYFGVLEDLGKLFQCPIDLVVISSIKNPFFLQAINQNRELLYAA